MGSIGTFYKLAKENRKMKEINKDFDIPYYVFEEIIKYVLIKDKTNQDWNKVQYFINMAVINERLSKEQARKLKEKYFIEKKIY